jgi:hypothetical protein
MADLRFSADAHRDNGKRIVVRADEKLTAFVELESAIRVCYRLDVALASISSAHL